jgi:hypothetical protein
MTRARLGSLITFLGAMGMVVVASKWPHDEIAAAAVALITLAGILMGLWK